MSRTHHKLRNLKRNVWYGSSKEYWKSRLHRHGEEPGRYTKNLTHKKERREGKCDPLRSET